MIRIYFLKIKVLILFLFPSSCRFYDFMMNNIFYVLKARTPT